MTGRLGAVAVGVLVVAGLVGRVLTQTNTEHVEAAGGAVVGPQLVRYPENSETAVAVFSAAWIAPRSQVEAWRLTGADAGDFDLHWDHLGKVALHFEPSRPDYEHPRDCDNNNAYRLGVEAVFSDGATRARMCWCG